MGWPALRGAFASGWGAAPGEAGAASLDLGPRPDVWIAESGAQVDIVAPGGQRHGFTVSDDWTLVAGSPLVLAVPESHAKALRATTGAGDTVQELMAAAAAAGLDVVRANPDASFAAALHTGRPLYGLRGVGAASGTVADAAALEALELDLGHALEQAGLPVGTDGALLCRLDELSRREPPPVAVLTTERAIGGRGAACPASGAGDERRRPGPVLPGRGPRPRLHGGGADLGRRRAGRRRADAASAFVEWLRHERGAGGPRRGGGRAGPGRAAARGRGRAAARAARTRR